MMHTSPYMKTVIRGVRPAMMRAAISESPVSFLFVSLKRSSSYCVRLKARTTRMPLIFSRMIWFTLSSSFCTLPYMGTMIASITPATTSSMGTTLMAVPRISGLVE